MNTQAMVILVAILMAFIYLVVYQKNRFVGDMFYFLTGIGIMWKFNETFITTIQNIPAPPAPTLTLINEAGLVANGYHQCRIAYLTKSGGQTEMSGMTQITVTDLLTAGKINITLPIPTDPGVTGRRVYCGISATTYVTWIADVNDITTNSYIFNLSDSTLITRGHNVGVTGGNIGNCLATTSNGVCALAIDNANGNIYFGNRGTYYEQSTGKMNCPYHYNSTKCSLKPYSENCIGFNPDCEIAVSFRQSLEDKFGNLNKLQVTGNLSDVEGVKIE